MRLAESFIDELARVLRAEQTQEDADVKERPESATARAADARPSAPPACPPAAA
ncbi:MAG: hypothetical protein AAF411_05005 [Myxococcota bacterium]